MNKAFNFNWEYFRWAEKVFFAEWEGIRYKCVAKGRRVGFTRSTAQFLIEQMLGANDLELWGNKKEDEGLYILWGDTIHGNIRRYFDRYFKTILDKIQQKIRDSLNNQKFKLYEYKTQDSMLVVHNGDIKSIIDFRSADKPENWEGFGYDLVILNEAGIILKNRSLWENSVAPMMLDNSQSKAIIGGVPKGKNLFYELWQRGTSEDYQRWLSYRFSSYDNPLLSEEDIEELKKGLSEKAIRQEIYGEFVDDVSNELFNYDEVERAMNIHGSEVGAIVWGLDVARHGDDRSVLAKRKGKHFYELKIIDENDLMKLAEYIAYEYNRITNDRKPDIINVDVAGMGWGVFDRLKQLGLPVMAVNTAEKSVINGIANKRAEMYWRLKEEHLKQDGDLIKDNDLLMELINTTYEINDRNEIKIIPKDRLKSELGRSPDKADAVALTYAQIIDVNKSFKRIYKKFNAGV